jgi:hypothetical protein
MSIKSKVLAAAATLTPVGGVGMAGALTAGTASAATPSCGHSCINIFSHSHESGTFRDPAYVVDMIRQDEKTSQPVIPFKTPNFDPAEDRSVSFQGAVADSSETGPAGAEHTLHYGCAPPANFAACYRQISVPVNDPAYTIEYAPYGGDSGLCAGVTAAEFNDEGVTLPPGGVPAKTLGIADIDNPATLLAASVAPINGSNTNFAQPFVLTYQAGKVTGRQAVQTGGTS